MTGCDERMGPQASEHCGGKPIGLLGPRKVQKWGTHNQSSTMGLQEALKWPGEQGCEEIQEIQPGLTGFCNRLKVSLLKQIQG